MLNKSFYLHLLWIIFSSFPNFTTFLIQLLFGGPPAKCHKKSKIIIPVTSFALIYFSLRLSRFSFVCGSVK